MVVRIDELQWSHAALRDLLAVLAHGLVGCPLLLAVTMRPDDEAQWPPDVDRVTTVTLPLGPLAPRESTQLVHALTGGRADDGGHYNGKNGGAAAEPRGAPLSRAEGEH